jgi:hypothetical protein
MSASAPTPPNVDPEELVEQAYFFRTFRERLGQQMPAQDILERLHEEFLSTTRIPMAVQFICTELKHSGSLANGFIRLKHYFTPFQAFVVQQTEDERRKFAIETALLVLEREALYKSKEPTPAGLFVFQFEVISRNRLGYDDGLMAVENDPIFDENWQHYIWLGRRQIGVLDFADLIYLRSEFYVIDQRRYKPGYVPSRVPLFGEKEGKIARASRGRDPLFLFAALQRHLNYPEVPRPRVQNDLGSQMESIRTKVRELEARLRIVEAESRGVFDPTQFGKPELFRDDDD